MNVISRSGSADGGVGDGSGSKLAFQIRTTGTNKRVCHKFCSHKHKKLHQITSSQRGPYEVMTRN